MSQQTDLPVDANKVIEILGQRLAQAYIDIAHRDAAITALLARHPLPQTDPPHEPQPAPPQTPGKADGTPR